MLLDLGSGALGPLQRLHRPLRVDAVLLSHLHPDHCFDLRALRRCASTARPARPGRSRSTARAASPTGWPAPTGGPSDRRDERRVRRPRVDPGQPVGLGPVHDHAVPGRPPGRGLRRCGSRPAAPCWPTPVTPAPPGAVDAVPTTPTCCSCDSAFVEGRDDPAGLHLTARQAGRAAAGQAEYSGWC